MSRKLVKIVEKAEYLSEDDGYLYYKGKVNELVCTIVYAFMKDQLVSAAYLFSEEYSNRNHYVDDFESVKKILTKKYGSPKQDLEHWDKELLKDDYSARGLAVSRGICHIIHYGKQLRLRCFYA